MRAERDTPPGGEQRPSERHPSELHADDQRLHTALRAALRATDAAASTNSASTSSAPPLDAAEVTRRARRRRMPRLVATGAAASLLVLGVGAVAVRGVTPLLEQQLASSAGSSQEVAPSAARPDSSTGPNDTGPNNTGPSDSSGSQTGDSGAEAADGFAPGLRCGDAIPAPAAPRGLALRIELPATAAIDEVLLRGAVVLQNTGDDALSAAAASQPVVLLEADGTIGWHSHGLAVQAVTELALQPGQQQRFPLVAELLHCASETQLLRGEAEPASAGEHLVVAMLELVLDDGTALQLVSEPYSIVLH